MKDAQCPGCYSQSFEHDDDGCQNSLCAKGYCGCKLTPAEIDAVLAMRANDLAVADAPDSATIAARDERASGGHTAPAGDGKKPGPSPLVSCDGCGIVRVPSATYKLIGASDSCRACGAVGRQLVVT